ncbi:MAG: glycosyltransferase, partial [Pseudoflavonifractor sp.]
MSIPKVIHYCWFGRNPLPEKALVCIASWQKFCPDYEIKQWNEDNFDFSGNRYAREAYEAKKWAFVSDYARLAVLYDHGGIYMDTDVELLKPLDEFLAEDAFSGFESDRYGITGIMAARAGHPWMGAMLNSYTDRPFLGEDGTPDLTTNTESATALMIRDFGFVPGGSDQILRSGIHIYPTDWFCPKDWRDGVICTTGNTHAIHHYAGSWVDHAEQRFTARFKKLIPIFG